VPKIIADGQFLHSSERVFLSSIFDANKPSTTSTSTLVHGKIRPIGKRLFGIYNEDHFPSNPLSSKENNFNSASDVLEPHQQPELPGFVPKSAYQSQQRRVQITGELFASNALQPLIRVLIYSAACDVSCVSGKTIKCSALLVFDYISLHSVNVFDLL